MKLSEYVAIEPLAAAIISDARELGLVPEDPGWHPENSSEPYSCQVDVFSIMAGDYDRMDLEVIRRSFDCLYWAGDDRDSAWLPAWMCASLYALFVRKREYGNLLMTTEWFLIRALQEDRLPVRLPTLKTFASRFLNAGNAEDAEEFYAALREYETARSTTSTPASGEGDASPPEN